ncbi:MAG: orotidine-5'-phosphate decarboxylase [Oscillospiraceae bacterium]|nr:orotidine-5'-phosphate decarboxylase [Oscillospiraceae bacterium]
MSFDLLQNKIREKKNPTAAGLDPRADYIPPHIREACLKEYGETLKAEAEAAYLFTCGLMDALCDIVPAVKPQSAFYEMLGWQGMEVLERTIRYAKEKNFFVILDGKRGDIGSTAEAYSAAFLGEVSVGSQTYRPFPCDALTINAYLGSDGIQPFLHDSLAHDTCFFALVKTSNASSGELQDLVAGDRLVYRVVGDLLERLGRGLEGKYGFTPLGAVVGATYPSDLHQLRRRLEHTFFLVPGYGAQGGSAADVRYAFNKLGHGAIVNSSRGIMCAWQHTGKNGLDYQDAARNAAIAMREDIRNYVTVV